jgi:type I restriction enzyme, S subunit
MSYLNKLLEGVEVEWQALENLAENLDSMRKPVTGGQREFGKVPYYGASGIVDYVKDYTFDGDFLLVSEDGANLLARNTPIAFSIKGKSWVNNHAHVLKFNNDVDRKFVEYYLNMIDLTPFISGAAQPKLNKKNLNSIKIPNPLSEIKKEIVRILDTFTNLTSELTTQLTAELTARKKQYNYYREKLFSFEDGEVEWKTLGELGEFVRGNGLPKSDFTETGIPAIHYGQIYTYYGTSTMETKSFVSIETARKLKKVNTGDVVITNTSENLEDVGKAVVYLGKEQAVTGGHASIFKPSKNITGKYFAYFTQTEIFATQKRKYAKGIKVIDVSATEMSKIIIPLPSLKEQERIVEILDKFESLISFICSSLQKEINLRNQQYVFYRNKLLTFTKRNNSIVWEKL